MGNHSRDSGDAESASGNSSNALLEPFEMDEHPHRGRSRLTDLPALAVRRTRNVLFRSKLGKRIGFLIVLYLSLV
jgi:hypothetical protein